MAKIISNIKKILLERKISNLRYDINFNQNYSNIKKERIFKKNHTKINKLERSFNAQLANLEIQKMSKEEYVKFFAKDKIEKINHKYVWKERALLNRLNKSGQANEDFIKQQKDGLLLEKEQKIAQLFASLESKYVPSNQTEISTQFSQLEKERDLAVLNLKNEIEEFSTLKFNEIDNAKENKDLSLKANLETAKNKLDIYLEEINRNKYSLDSDYILELENITMQFGGLRAVDDLSFKVKKGEIFGLIGPNGAGKTTVFNCITQFYKATSGKAYYVNKTNDTILLNSLKVHNVIKQGIVRTFQNVELVAELNVLDNLLVGAHHIYRTGFFRHSIQSIAYRREEEVLRKRALSILTNLGIVAYKDFYPIGLPYGVLKKIELARTLMTNPSLIILDEPAAGLNEAETAELAQTIKNIRDKYKTTIFLVEHDMGLVMGICDTICAISFGKMLAVGTPKEIQANPLVQEAYLGGS